MADPTPALLTSLADSCRATAGVLRQLGAEAFVDRRQGASVGEHVRHCIDHFAVLLDGLEAGGVDYDRRRRGWAGETDHALAADTLDAIAARIAALDPAILERPLTVQVTVEPGRPAATLTSTVARELCFCQSHLIHHNALISKLAAGLGRELPGDFGYAPCTLAHLAGRCAPPAS